jgi:DNA-binding NarL/FixJ family response regulator
MIKIIIVDDQVLLRRSLGQLISIDESINVVDMVGTGRDAVHSCIEMPEMNGIEALRIIKKSYPDIKIIMLTTFENTDKIIEAIVSDADGYLTKDIGCDELITTLKCVHNGMTVIHKSVKKVVMEKFNRLTEGKASYKDILTKEEIDTVNLIVEGKSNRDIATEFNYSEGTVKNKVSRIYEKLGLSDRLQLAVFAVENGMG